MKIISKLLFLLFIISLSSCDKEEESTNGSTNSTFTKTIEIGDYLFDFPVQFELTERQGTDSYVGIVAGSGIELTFDFGVFTSPYENLSKEKFEIIEETFDSVERQIVVANNPSQDFTALHIRDLENFSPLGNYVSLNLTANNLSLEQQKLIIEVYESARLID